MLKRLLTVAVSLVALTSSSAFAVYFPSGIDWANPSQQRFITSMYLNVLGRAPYSGEVNTAMQLMGRTDNSQTRLDLFKKFLESDEYRRTFPDSNSGWMVYRAPDRNYGSGVWRYRAAPARPGGFESWELSGASSEAVAKSMAVYYSTYCYEGIPCVADPAVAYQRDMPVQTASDTHACADESSQIARYQWVANNGTTYPTGTDATTLCMGSHYFKAVGTVLQRFQCDSGYRNCQRDRARDIRGERSGQDSRGNPALFFSDGSRLILTNYDEIQQANQAPQSPVQPQPRLAQNQHECADPAQVTRYYQWNGTDGASESPGVGNSTICMRDYYYNIEGMTLKHFACDSGFTNCRANAELDVTAQRRTRVDGQSALQFRNGTTLSIMKNAPASTTSRSQNNSLGNNTNLSGVQSNQSTQRLAGQHECGVATMRLSQFRWSKRDGTTDWPDGVDGRVVCLDNAYYEIENFTLRHFQCTGNFQNCRSSRGKDLIAIRDSTDNNGLRTLIFANGEQLALISR